MREIVHIQAGQCGNQIGAKVRIIPTSCNMQKYKFDLKFREKKAKEETPGDKESKFQ